MKKSGPNVVYGPINHPGPQSCETQENKWWGCDKTQRLGKGSGRGTRKEEEAYFSRCVCTDTPRPWLPLSADKHGLFLVQGGDLAHRRFHALPFGRTRETRKLFLHLLFLRCLQPKMINVSKQYIWAWHVLNPFNDKGLKTLKRVTRMSFKSGGSWGHPKPPGRVKCLPSSLSETFKTADDADLIQNSAERFQKRLTHREISLGRGKTRENSGTHTKLPRALRPAQMETPTRESAARLLCPKTCLALGPPLPYL